MKMPKIKLVNIVKHFCTITRHRLLVCKHCFKIGLYWQGLTHDLSKYSPEEFWTGVRYYQGDRSPNAAEREAIGFSKAWLHHKGRNKHHFEYWIDVSLNKEEDHFNGTINLPIQTLQSTQLISQTNGETNSEVLDIDVNFENYLDEDASGGIMLESYNEKKNKGDFTLSFSGNKTKKDEIYLWDKEYNFKRNTEYHDVKGTIYINSDKEYIEFEQK